MTINVRSLSLTVLQYILSQFDQQLRQSLYLAQVCHDERGDALVYRVVTYVHNHKSILYHTNETVHTKTDILNGSYFENIRCTAVPFGVGTHRVFTLIHEIYGSKL